MSLYLKKCDVIQCGLGGMTIHGFDLVRRRRACNGTVFELRHTWPEGTDGRVWDAIRRGVLKYVQERANIVWRTCEVYSKDGTLVWTATPSRDGALVWTGERAGVGE